MGYRLKSVINIYWCIFLAFVMPARCKELCIKSDNSLDQKNIDAHLKRFRKTYFEAILVTAAALFASYLFAGFPTVIPWNKLIPTLLLAFPIYGTRNPGFLTFGGKGLSEKMDILFFKTTYVVGIIWLAWDIFKGII